jgi:hypothetical protein
MAAGHGTYISNLLETVGFRNGLEAGRVRFPKLGEGEALDGEVDLHLFPSEPYGFDLPGDLGEFWSGEVAASPYAFVVGGRSLAMAVDGQLLSWYPSLTEEGLRYGCRMRELGGLVSGGSIP